MPRHLRMEPRRERVVPTAPGEGVVAIQTPLAAMLAATCGVDAYVRMVRGGELDVARSAVKFNSSPQGIAQLRERGRELPDGLPNLHGDVTWRRVARRWSLDAKLAMLAPEVFFWSSVAKGIAQIRFDGVLLAQTIVDNLPGRRLSEVVEHPFLTDPGIVIVSATSDGPYPAIGGMGNGRPAMTQFQITVPVIEVPDPAIQTIGPEEDENDEIPA